MLPPNQEYTVPIGPELPADVVQEMKETVPKNEVKDVEIVIGDSEVTKIFLNILFINFSRTYQPVTEIVTEPIISFFFFL